MNGVIKTEHCIVRTSDGEQVTTTLEMRSQNTGDGQNIIGWNFISEPGIQFARKNCGMDRSNDYTRPRKPKCPPEFWRRERRVKVLPTEVVMAAKEEIRELAKQIKDLQLVINRLAEEHRAAMRHYKGVFAERHQFKITIGSVPVDTAQALKEAHRNRIMKQREYEAVQLARMSLQQLYRRKTKYVLGLRQLERLKRT